MKTCSMNVVIGCNVAAVAVGAMGACMCGRSSLSQEGIEC